METPAQLFSQGQRRRLALARLVAVKRPVWLLDEPTAGLDTASRTAFAALMSEHLAGGGMILAATHEPLGDRHRDARPDRRRDDRADGMRRTR